MRGADGTSEHSPHFDIARGVLQRDILSPVCFIVGLQKIFQECNKLSAGKFSQGAKVLPVPCKYRTRNMRMMMPYTRRSPPAPTGPTSALAALPTNLS